jgi:copper transport protein
VHVSAFGRGYVDLWLCFALFVAAAGLAIRIDRPDREQRSLAELLAAAGAYLAAGSALLVPGLSGHAAQTSPRGLSLLFDWSHLAAGSLWLGGLGGLLVLWRSLPVASRIAGLVVAVPRFSNTAFVSVVVLLASGTGASVLHLPTLASLKDTSYGQALLVKIALLVAASGLAAVNLLRAKPRLARPEVGVGSARLLRRLVGGEVVLVAAAVFAAAVLSSIAPPSKALASVGGATGHVGPGPVKRVVQKDGYTLAIHISPNKAAIPNAFSVQITRGGTPVRHAEVVVRVDMLDMTMQQQAYRLTETSPGTYARTAPALVMVGHWGLAFDVTATGGRPVRILLLDRANG